jgi:3'-5' exonuclease
MNSSQRIIVLDIETVGTDDPAIVQTIIDSIKPPGTMSRAETIAAWERDKKPEAVVRAIAGTALDGGLGSVTAVGWQHLSIDPLELRVQERDEEQVRVREPGHGVHDFLGETFKAMGESPFGMHTPIVAGHNVVGFDLPFLWQQCVRHGVRAPVWLPVLPSAWDRNVLDTMAAWAGPRNSIGLSDLALILGVERDAESIPSENVPAAYRDGDLSAVERHLRDDILVTTEVVERILAAGWTV